METIAFEDFAKIDLRVARVLSAERVSGADKLLKLRVSLGAQERVLVAGIAQHYSPEELAGKKIVVVANLAPRLVRGIESQGMLLAALTDDQSVVALLAPDKDVPEGSKVS